MKNKIIGAALIAALGIGVIGCGNKVDEKKLVELTGDKNFAQIKQAWQNSILQDKKNDAKIYSYWLEENGEKAQSTFNADSFEQSFMMKYNKGIEDSKKKMSEMEKSVDKAITEAKQKGYFEIDYTIARAIRHEKQMASFAAFSSAFVRHTYIPFLSKQLKKISDANIELKKQRDDEMTKEINGGT